jgi:hypothetical protein
VSCVGFAPTSPHRTLTYTARPIYRAAFSLHRIHPVDGGSKVLKNVGTILASDVHKSRKPELHITSNSLKPVDGSVQENLSNPH